MHGLQPRIVAGGHGHGASGQQAGGPLAMRRLFVYSLLYTTTDETLHSVFSQYGELEEAVIIKDKNNEMKSKGYGFVIYKHVGDAQNALKQPHKMIDGRTVHCSLAIDGQNHQNHGHGGNGMSGHGLNGMNVNAAARSHGHGGHGVQAQALSMNPGLNALSAVLQQQQALQQYDPYHCALHGVIVMIVTVSICISMSLLKCMCVVNLIYMIFPRNDPIFTVQGSFC